MPGFTIHMAIAKQYIKEHGDTQYGIVFVEEA